MTSKFRELFFIPADYWLPFAINDIKTQFRRSIIGPFWIALTSAVLILSLSTIFSFILDVTIVSYLPYVGFGVITWQLINGLIYETSIILTVSRHLLLNVPLPPLVYIYRSLIKTLVNGIVNFLTVIIFILFLDASMLSGLPLMLFGLLLVLFSIVPMTILLSIICLRFRDIPHIITNFMQVMFFLTPVFWNPELTATKPLFVTFNPFYYLITLVRGPIVSPELLSIWNYIATFLFGVILWFLAAKVLKKFSKKIVYWS